MQFNTCLEPPVDGAPAPYTAGQFWPLQERHRHRRCRPLGPRVGIGFPPTGYRDRICAGSHETCSVQCETDWSGPLYPSCMAECGKMRRECDHACRTM